MIPVAKFVHGRKGFSVLGEIMTWVGVAIAALVTFALYRSAERANFRNETKDHPADE